MLMNKTDVSISPDVKDLLYLVNVEFLNLHTHLTHIYDEYGVSITVPYKCPKQDSIHRQ